MASVIIGDYRYTSFNASEASVAVVDNTKTSYGAILSSVTIDGVEYSVTVMYECFKNCTSLITAPEIPSSVTMMSYCFNNCDSLINAPVIPNSVENMAMCFYGCNALVTAPIIPSSVLNVNSCFRYCTSLSGDIIVYNNPFVSIERQNVFKNTHNSITICPRSTSIISTWQTIANEYSNVSVVLDPQINYTFLSSRRLTPTENTTYGTTRGIRIDMLLDCGNSYALTGMTPSSGKLYTIDGTQITFPYYSPNLLRCYLIYEPSSQVPTGKLTIQVQNINTTFNSLQVYLPSTATISQFEQKESDTTKQLAPQINELTSLTFNPQNNNVTNVKSLVSYIYQSATGNTLTPLTNDNKTQINTLKSDNTLDIKHFVTTADNIQVTTDKTLQDIITECYNALET